MDPSLVIIRYDPARWTELAAENGENGEHSNDREYTEIGEMADFGEPAPEASPSKFVSFSYAKQGTLKQTQTHQVPRKRHLVPLSASSFERPIKESLANLENYTHFLKMGSPIKEVEQSWYNDLANVGQRLKFLRDTFKVIQSVRKRKMMGQRADFRTLYDAKVSRTGSPSLSDDEVRNSLVSDDEDAQFRPPVPVVAVSRRGRPRKRRGRERKAPLGRAEMVKRTRASRRALDPSSPPDGDQGSPAATPDYSAESTPLLPKRRGRYAARQKDENGPDFSYAEPQGPPLMHSPPILPSQRHTLVQGIPPYRHLMGPGALSPAYKPSSPSHVDNTAAETPRIDGKTPYLPSQVSFPVAQYNPGSALPGSSGSTPGYLPSQSSLQGVIPFSFQNYPPPQNLAENVPAVPKPNLKPDHKAKNGYSLPYGGPLAYTNYPTTAYSASTGGSIMGSQNTEPTWEHPQSISRPPMLPSVAPRPNLASESQSMPAYQTPNPVKPIEMKLEMKPLNTANPDPPKLPAISRDQIYPRLVPQAAPAMPMYSSWQASYPERTQSAESLGMALPSLQALENEIKQRSEYDGEGHI